MFKTVTTYLDYIPTDNSQYNELHCTQTHFFVKLEDAFLLCDFIEKNFHCNKQVNNLESNEIIRLNYQIDENGPVAQLSLYKNAYLLEPICSPAKELTITVVLPKEDRARNAICSIETIQYENSSDFYDALFSLRRYVLVPFNNNMLLFNKHGLHFILDKQYYDLIANNNLVQEDI